jgi:hypothetical protein
MARYWYSYVIPTADPRLASSYQRIKANNGSPRCANGTLLCAINAPEGGPFPLGPLSTNLLDYIAAALANGAPQPERPFGAKLFVYLKTM